MPFLIELWNSQHGMVWDRLTGTGLGWMRRPTFKCSQYTAPTFPIQLQYGTFGTGVATAQKFAQVWLQAGYDQKKCGNCCTSFPKIHCGSRWFWVLLENKKLQGSVVMSVSTTTQEYNCFDKHLNTSLLRKLWQPWLLGKPHWNSCCAPNHPGKGLDPPSNQANAHLILANSSLKKCPKPSGQGSRPPPYGQCPNACGMNLRGASLTRGWIHNLEIKDELFFGNLHTVSNILFSSKNIIFFGQLYPLITFVFCGHIQHVSVFWFVV